MSTTFLHDFGTSLLLTVTIRIKLVLGTRTRSFTGYVFFDDRTSLDMKSNDLIIAFEYRHNLSYTMKIAVATLLAGSAIAFTPSTHTAFRLNALSAVETGPKGTAAKSAEEDLKLTMEVILDHIKIDSDEPAPATEESDE